MIDECENEVRFRDPYVFILEIELCDQYCSQCFEPVGKNVTLKRCSGCRLLQYCSQKCQVAAWKRDHKLECGRLKASFPLAPPSTTLFYARLIDRLRKEKVDICLEEPTPPTGIRHWRNLMQHSEELGERKNRVEHVKKLRESLASFMGPDLGVTEEELWSIYCKKVTNAHDICNNLGESIGYGMDFQGSAYDHSCRPNVGISFEGKTLVFRSLVPGINVRDTSSAFISYVELFQGRKQRQEKLLHNYCFLCSCPRCVDPADEELSGFLCPETNCDSTILEHQDRCPSCNSCPTEEHRNQILQFNDHVDQLLDPIETQFQTDPSQAFELCEQDILKMDRLVPSTGILASELRVLYVQLSLRSGRNRREALNFAKEALPCLRYCYQNHKKLGFHLMKTVLLQLKLSLPQGFSDIKAIVELTLESRDLFSRWFGPAHRYTRALDVFTQKLSARNQGTVLTEEEIRDLILLLKFD